MPDAPAVAAAVALFEFDHHAGTITPTELSRGPWSPLACHGGPVAALMARECERAGRVGEDGWQVVRITVELERPVPLEPLVLSSLVERPGRKVSLVGASLHHAGTGARIAQARASLVRQSTIELPQTEAVAAEPSFAGPEHGRLLTAWRDNGVAYHTHSCEHRFVEGGWDADGEVKVWIRLTRPVVEGETPSGLQRACAAADFGNGVSRALPDNYLFINPDLTVHLLRPVIGEWIGMHTRSHYGPLGAGMAESALYDQTARVGRSVQSLLLDFR